MVLKQLLPVRGLVGPVVNIVIIPGIGTPPPSDWSDYSGQWLQELQKLHGGKVLIWHYVYEAVKGQAIVASVLQQSHALTAELHKLNPRETVCLPMVMICHSLGGCIWKQAYANMNEIRHENSNILDKISGAVFLGTPHVDRDVFNINIIEAMVRVCSNAPVSFISFTSEDNEKIAGMSRNFASFDGQVLSAYETVESKYPRQIKHFWKGPFTKPRIVVHKDIAIMSANTSAELCGLYGLPKAHEDLCKVDVKGQFYKCVVMMVNTAKDRQASKRSPEGTAAQSVLSIEDNIPDDWDMASLRSHRSRIGQAVAGASRTSLPQEQNPTQANQGTLLPPSLMEVKESTTTPSPSAGYSSQLSYEIVPSNDHMEPDERKLKLPCFSIGSQTRRSPFFGGDDVFRAIDTRLLPESISSPVDERSFSHSPGGNLKTFALCGAGGVGKTSIASEYVFTRRDKFSAIFWVTADQRNNLLEDFARIAVELGLQDKNAAHDTACELVKGWLCNPVEDIEAPLRPENEISWLLVLDNVDDWAVIEDFWPTTGIGSVLITSRDPLSRSHIYTAKHGWDLAPLNLSDTLDFLDAVSQKHFKGDQAAAKAIAGRCGGLPLVIASIASTMSTQDLTYNSMLDLLTNQGFGATTEQQAIVSVIGLERMDPHTRSLILVLSFLFPDGIPQKLLYRGKGSLPLDGYPTDLAEVKTAQENLQRASLVSFNDTTQTLRMHRIYQEIVRQALEPAERDAALISALEIVSNAWVYQPLEHRFNSDRYDACSAVFPHVDQVFQHYGLAFNSGKMEGKQTAAALFNDAGWYWFERGLPQESKPFCVLAQKVCEALLRTQPSEAVSEMLRESHNNLGSMANETNDRQDSLQHNLVWLGLIKERRVDGNEVIDYELGCAYSEVGVAYACSNMYYQALDHFRLSISTYKTLPNYDEKWLGWPLPNIGLVLWAQGNYKLALEELFRMHEIYAVHGTTDGDAFKRGKVLYGIGNVYLSLGDLDHSLEYHKLCLGQWSKVFDGTHHRIGDVCHKLAQGYIGRTQFNLAQEHLSRALRIFAHRSYHKQEHARTVFRQGQLYLASGKSELAEQQFIAAHKQRQALVPSDTRPWYQMSEKDYDELVMFWSR
ncbi:unnamed protein product [Zymoseptoria tritici ST99CH_3D1]|nr:unnamed protein product [Zymoseptoria tritici ST99CH_3D1]